MRATDTARRERLLAQDCLTTLIELDPNGMHAEITGSMIGFLPVKDGNAALIAQMDRPEIRILNGGHQVISDAGDVLGIGTIADTMAHPLIKALLRKVVSEEIAPHVSAVPGMTPAAYLGLIDRRFSTPKIKDTTRRVAYDGSSRHPGFIVPSIREGLAAGTPVDGLALVSALWARYCQGIREDGSEIAPKDPNWTHLHATAASANAMAGDAQHLR